ncbi:MAG: hypothetical protein SFY66_13910 [Oculatellaceae cyanobacterium bins.114]|nr:hypothetical protein [Oculatellaceae cyanobacterium bins.114]
MGYAVFVTFDRLIPNVEAWNMCGKILAHNLDALDDVANRLNLHPLTEMISISAEDLENLLDEPVEDALEEQWFSPQVGLATVTALSTFVEANADQFDHSPQLLEDLAEVKHYLELAEQHNVQFHFSVDI